MKTVAATLTQLHAREEKTHGFLAFLLKNMRYFIGLNTSLSYIRMVMGEKLCLNVPFWSISKILKRVAATLTQLHAREEKTHGFLAFLLKNIHYFIGLNTSLSYIRMVMGEKLCLNVPFWSISRILKRVAATLTQLHVREEKTHGFLPFLFENIYHFIDLNTSLSYIRMVMREKLC